MSLGASRRIVVFLNEGYPELAASLAEIKPRHRAERLRALASVGLAVLNGTHFTSEFTGKLNTASTTAYSEVSPQQPESTPQLNSVDAAELDNRNRRAKALNIGKLIDC